MNIDKKIIENVIDNLTFKFPYTIDEYVNNPIIENYHYHSYFSNVGMADSPTNNENFAKRIKELNGKCIFSGEHGWQGNQFEVYEIAEKYGLKYRHSTEAYWVKNRLEQDRTNCHICLIALTPKARKDINYILSIANIDGYYGNPRIDLELLLSLNPNEVIVTSACVAGWKYDDAENIWLKVANYFGDNFFFEIQPHNTDKQKELNQKILELSKEHNIQIICGLDSHYIDTEIDDIKREKILEYKKIKYDDEQGWYLDFPNIETIYNRLKEQGVLSEYEIWQSIMNTNVFNSNKAQEIILDKSFKIPSIYKDKTYGEKVKIFKNVLNNEYANEKDKSKARVEGIRYEAEQVIDSKVVDYFLTNRAILQEAINNQGGILTKTSRGSMSSFYINKLLGFTTLDRFNAEVPIYPERFLTKERVQSGQMPDCDFNIAQQEPFVKAARKLIGKESCYPLMAIEKMKTSAAWQMYASVNNIEPTIANEVSKQIKEYEEKKKHLDEDSKDLLDISDFIPKEYIDIYNKSKEYQGIVTNLKVHACAFLLFDGDIRREIGLTSAVSQSTKKRTLVVCAEGKYLDTFGYVKDDFLIVDVVGLIQECWDSINQPVPTFNELRELIKDDDATWDIYAKGIVCCVNQVEKKETAKKAQVYQMKNLGESASFIAGIRPGFKSLLPTFLHREKFTTGESKIDDLLKESSSFILYQESVMKILAYLGLSMAECYTVIKSISKKKYKEHPEKLKALKEQLLKGWTEKIGKTDNFDKVWQVIEDAASYSFNSPHALSMAGDSAYIAYFKAHYPANFYKVAISHYMKKDNKKKIAELMSEANTFFGYKTKLWCFGEDNRDVIVDEKNKTITLAMSSIKDMQKIAPQILYDLGQTNNINNVMQLFENVLKCGVNKTSRNILIKLDYFKNFGTINQLLYGFNIYEKFANSKVISKNKLSEIELKAIQGNFNKETKTQFREINNKKFIFDILKSSTIPPTTDLTKAHYQLQLLGSTNIVIPNCEYYGVESVETNSYGTPFITLYDFQNGMTKQFKCNKKWYDEFKCKQGDIVEVSFSQKKKVRFIGTDENGKNIYQPTGEYEDIIKLYSIIDIEV